MTDINRINKDFIICLTYAGEKSQLIGAGQYEKHLGLELQQRHFKKVLASLTDRTVIKLRRGLKIEFITK